MRLNMKKKFLIIILIILIILLSVLMIFRSKLFKKDHSKKETSGNFILDSNTSSKVNTSGENSGIYVGINDDDKENFIFISIKINKKDSKENQIESLISEISTSIGYKININNLEIDENKIKIDFDKAYAPFELEESYKQTDAQKYFIASSSAVAKTIFDSINKTLKSYFGADTEVYFSVNSENINISNDLMTINLDKNVAYE